MSRITLYLNEPHPAALDAMKWVMRLSPEELCKWQEAFASCAIENNRLAEICCKILRRLLAGEPISDRYLLGLAWAMAGKKRRYCENS